jgi:hypothetical protein
MQMIKSILKKSAMKANKICLKIIIIIKEVGKNKPIIYSQNKINLKNRHL